MRPKVYPRSQFEQDILNVRLWELTGRSEEFFSYHYMFDVSDGWAIELEEEVSPFALVVHLIEA